MVESEVEGVADRLVRGSGEMDAAGVVVEVCTPRESDVPRVADVDDLDV